MKSGALLADTQGVYTRDPCAVLSVDVTLEAGDEQAILFLLGDATSEAHAHELVTRHRQRSFDA